jgi:two-component system sensor histidine kinase TctE
MRWSLRPRSVRAYLLAWIIVPIAVLIVIDAFVLYRNTLESVNAAYDRMLIASAHSIGDLLRIEKGQLEVALPYAVLEIYEANASSKMIYRIDGLDGKFLFGDEALPKFTGTVASHASYPSLVHIYEDIHDGDPVRVAALLQPVASLGPAGSALIQVAETLEKRSMPAQKIFWDTLIRQGALLVIMAALILLVVSRALRPLDALRQQLDGRLAEDLSPVAVPGQPRELQPFVDALNQMMLRLHLLLDHQQRFVANASHQLRTPLAVLKTQLQSGLRGDAPPQMIIEEMVGTVERATSLANQLLSLAKVAQLRGHGAIESCDLTMLARETAVDLSPLIAEKNLDFELDADKVQVQGHPWMIGELLSNLLHNAIFHAPPDSRMGIRIADGAQQVTVCVWDSGPGVAGEMIDTAFEPFTSSHSSSGLGLTICSEIADSMGARLSLENRIEGGRVAGLNAQLLFPKAGQG